MKCPKDLLELYIDNRLNKAEQEFLKEHLTHCSRCREELNRSMAMVNALKTCEVPELHNYFLDNVMSIIEFEPSPAELELKRRKLIARYLGWGSIFLTVGLLAGIFSLFGDYIGNAVWTALIWLWGQTAAIFPSAVNLLSIWQGVGKLAAVLIDTFEGSQYLWPVVVLSGLLAVTMARDILVDVQRVLGYRK